MISIRYTALLFITFIAVFRQVSTQMFDGFGFFKEDKGKDGEKKQNRGPFDFFAPQQNETAKREEALKKITFSLLNRK